MAWTRVQGAVRTAEFTGSPAATTAVTLGSAVSVGDTILVQAPCGDVVNQAALAALSAAVTDSLGNTYNRLSNAQGGNLVDTGNLQGTCFYWCIVTAAGTPTITFTPNGGSGKAFIAIQVDHFTGSTPTSTLRDSKGATQTNPGTGTDAIKAASVAALNGDLCWGATNDAGSATSSAVIGTGYTAASTINAVIGAITEYRTATGTHDASFTDSAGGSHTYMTAGIAISAGAAGAVGRRPRNPSLRPRVRLYAKFPKPPVNWGASAVVSGNTTVLPDVGVGTWTGLAPTVINPIAVFPGVGAATWTGIAPTVTVSVVVPIGLGQATWAGLAPTILNPQSALPGVGAATWTGLAPTVKISIVVAPGLGAATWTGLAPTVVATNNVTVSPGVGQATWSGVAPTITGIVVTTVAGGPPQRRPKAQQVRRSPQRQHQYFEMAEDIRCEPQTGQAIWAGLRPKIWITDVAAEERVMMRLAVDDEDVLMALALADAWMS